VTGGDPYTYSQALLLTHTYDNVSLSTVVWDESDSVVALRETLLRFALPQGVSKAAVVSERTACIVALSGRTLSVADIAALVRGWALIDWRID